MTSDRILFCRPGQTFLQTVTNLGVKGDSGFSVDRQFSAVLKSIFFNLRQLVKPYLSIKHFEPVVHAFVTVWLDYCNSLYFVVSYCCSAFSWFKILLYSC